MARRWPRRHVAAAVNDESPKRTGAVHVGDAALADDEFFRQRQPPAGTEAAVASQAGVVHPAEHQGPVGTGHQVPAHKGEVAGCDVHEAHLQAVEQRLRVREEHVDAPAQVELGHQRQVALESGVRRARRLVAGRGAGAAGQHQRGCQRQRGEVQEFDALRHLDLHSGRSTGHTLARSGVRFLTHLLVDCRNLGRISYRFGP